jgi:hypothetical protein
VTARPLQRCQKEIAEMSQAMPWVCRRVGRCATRLNSLVGIGDSVGPEHNMTTAGRGMWPAGTGDRTDDLAEAECCGVWSSSDRYNAVWQARARNW